MYDRPPLSTRRISLILVKLGPAHRREEGVPVVAAKHALAPLAPKRFFRHALSFCGVKSMLCRIDYIYIYIYIYILTA